MQKTFNFFRLYFKNELKIVDSQSPLSWKNTPAKRQPGWAGSTTSTARAAIDENQGVSKPNTYLPNVAF